MPDSLFEPTMSSPLSGLGLPAGGIRLDERADVGKLNLRGDPQDPAFLGSIKQTLGAALPLEANTAARNDRYTIFWLGPDEWLIHTRGDERSGTEVAVRDSVKALHTAVTDVSDYYLVMRMSGGKSREVLSKGTPFDVHPSVFGAGACAQTRFGHATILLHCVDSAPTFDIQVRWSFAEYLWSFLVDGAKEYADTGGA